MERKQRNQSWSLRGGRGSVFAILMLASAVAVAATVRHGGESHGVVVEGHAESTTTVLEAFEPRIEGVGPAAGSPPQAGETGETSEATHPAAAGAGVDDTVAPVRTARERRLWSLWWSGTLVVAGIVLIGYAVRESLRGSASLGPSEAESDARFGATIDTDGAHRSITAVTLSRLAASRLMRLATSRRNSEDASEGSATPRRGGRRTSRG